MYELRQKALWASIVVGFLGGSLKAAAVVVVLGGAGTAFSDAADGVKTVFPDAQVVTVPEQPSLKGAKVVLTFGAAAAAQSVPGSLPLVVAMLADPNFEVEHSGSVTRVGFPPEAAVLAAKIKALDPKVTTLAVIDPKGAYAPYFSALKTAAAAHGMSVQVKKVGSVSSLVGMLPGLKGTVQALYVPPDSLLMTSSVFTVLTHFCHDSAIGLFAPVLGLEKAGALAAVAPSYKDLGKAAALAGQTYLQGGNPGEWVYSAQTEAARNEQVAADLALGD